MKIYGKILCLALLAASCSAEAGPKAAADAPDEYRADVVVTIKQDTDGTVFFQYGKDRLFPGEGYPFPGQCRAMGSVTIYAAEVPLYGHRVYVNWLEPIDAGTFLPQYSSVHAGGDGIDILTSSWITSVEDGYLTLHYKAWWGEPAGHHDFNLAQGSDPYELTVCHNAHGDGRDVYSEGTVYFDINALPPTEDGPHKLKINWTTTEGKPASAEFEFETRK